ncbi:MAG: imidazole glycerol phosphate synthase subunit HisH [Verrucomicrobia bacterium]|nr:imidazole glycerol phosphate synthase subunit HisH [Verrucomicrobiota bacterium]
MINIVDYGLGNLRSIQNMLQRIGVNAQISGRKEDLKAASKLILPGVGHFAFAMARLHELGLVDVLNEQVQGQKIPVLGICLGAQLLGKHSEEGDCEGLGWVDMKTVAFDRSRLSPELKVPHMGWAETTPCRPGLMDGLPAKSRFYYVHSYHFVCQSPETVTCVANHGYEFASGIQQGNVFGFQFHPEKSHDFGLQLLKNFTEV